MKKLISCFVFLLGITVLSFAQNQNNGQREQKTPEQRADMHTQKLTQDLSLSADQVTQVKASLLKHAQNDDAIRQKHANDTDKSAMRQELKAEQDQKDADLKTILTADQYTKYQSLKSQGHGGGQGGQGEHHGNH